MQRVTPYTTKSGLQIGRYYTAPRHNPMSREDEQWQAILLGDRDYWTLWRKFLFALYLVSIGGALLLLAAFGA